VFLIAFSPPIFYFYFNKPIEGKQKRFCSFINLKRQQRNGLFFNLVLNHTVSALGWGSPVFRQAGVLQVDAPATAGSSKPRYTVPQFIGPDSFFIHGLAY